MSARIRIGISSCLLGQMVRYDGGHKHNEYIVVTLGKYFDFVPFCPEVTIGLGVPRAPIRLVQSTHGTRARGSADPTAKDGGSAENAGAAFPPTAKDGGSAGIAGAVFRPAFDVTDQLAAYAERIAAELHDVSGYIFKAGSSSCGMERVPVYGANGAPVAAGAGIYAATLMALLPELPCEEEGRLMDTASAKNFIERVFVYHRSR